MGPTPTLVNRTRVRHLSSIRLSVSHTIAIVVSFMWYRYSISYETLCVYILKLVTTIFSYLFEM